MKRRGRGQPETIGHADDWLMTYADMITLLLCFFAIFLAVALMKKDAAHQPALPAPTAAAPPAPRPIMVVQTRLPPLEREPLAWQEPAPPPKSEPTPLAPPPEAQPQAAVAVAPIAPPVLAADKEQPGDRITIVELDSAAFFDRGSAGLSKAGEAILREVATSLRAEKYSDYQATVEGHTDDTPINTAQFPSNWELSAARAASVVRFLLDQGVAAQKLRAAGYADTFPKLPNRDAAGNPLPDNQAQNRRVVIKLEKIEKARPLPRAIIPPF